jgi:hypothetical protein
MVMRCILVLARVVVTLLLSVVAVTTPALSQCLLCGDAASPLAAPARATDSAGSTVRPLSITITANLDFARLTSGDAGGALSIEPATGAVVPHGRVRQLGGMAFAGRADVEGEPGAAVRVELPTMIEMTSSSGGRVQVRNLRTDLGSDARIGADGRLSFAFGGDLNVRGDVDGQFRGRITIHIDYE